MPLQVPNLDDRDFEQLLEEAKRRIPVYTPEWTNFDIDSDPGITLVQLFAFLTESLLYRANRIPERDRLKFLQLLGVPLQKAAAAKGVIAIRNERGQDALPLDAGVVVTAGNVGFLTLDGVTVLPVESRAYYKRQIPPGTRFDDFAEKYQSIVTALAAADGESVATSSLSLTFYETQPMEQPVPGNPNPVLDLQQDTLDRAIYLALLAPENVDPDTVRPQLVGKVLSIGVAPAQDSTVPPLSPVRPGIKKQATAGLAVELPDAKNFPAQDRYARLNLIQQPDVLSEVGVLQVLLPAGVDALKTWEFSEPLTEGTLDYPPRLEDERLKNRLVTWIRVRLPRADETSAQIPAARLRWIGINATRVQQAIPVLNEPLGNGTGEPDQVAVLANTPVIEASLQVVAQDANGGVQVWRMTDDLLAARSTDAVFSLDPEAGQIRFGDGLRGLRPQRELRLFASYLYGGGPQGNVNIGAIKSTPNIALQSGFRIENPIPTWGGDRGETVAEGERNIPLYLRHRDRLVTALDFADVTRRTPGVDIGRVEVLPVFDPTKPEEEAAGVVTVLVIPQFDAVQPLWPVPDRQFIKTVCDYLDARRLVTTEIYVRGPEYIPVWVSVGVQVQDGYFHDTVLQAVTERIHLYLSSLPPGGVDGQGWSLNRRLLSKDLEAAVTRVPGVEFVNDTLLMKVGNNLTELRGLQLPQLVGLSVVEGSPVDLSVLTEGTTGSAASVHVVPIPVSKAKC